MTTSPAVGALAADLLIGGSEKKLAPFAPDRFRA
jgi:glycine/D-amino acid oxidase-like deaminating enzyme